MELTTLFGLATAVGTAAGGIYKFGLVYGVRGTLIAGGIAVILGAGGLAGFLTWRHFHPNLGPYKFQTTDVLFATLQGDLEKLPEQERSRRRYFTLTHLANHSAVPAKVLRSHREALTRVVQTLASVSEPVLVPVDADGTVFACDLGRLGWSDSQWTEVLRCYPYGLKHDQDPDAVLRGLAATVYEETDCGQPAVRGDWFVVAVTRSPLGAALHQGTPLPVDASLAGLVNQVDESYHKDLGPDAAAVELGLASPNELMARLEVASSRQGLQPLLDRKPIQRAAWEAVDQGLSLFQRAARALQLGSPYRQL